MTPSTSSRPDQRRALVVGFGASGRSSARFLVEEGWSVVVVDDRPDALKAEAAARLGATWAGAVSPECLASLAAKSDEVVVSPGVPLEHPVFRLGRPLVGELELGARAAEVPVVAITGTNGKTTVVTLVTAMLERSGRLALACGNIGLPLTEAVRSDAEVLVVEASSFQLALATSLGAEVAAWLNLSPNHLDWHRTLEHYIASKARLFEQMDPSGVAVANADDPVVEAHLPVGGRRVVRFGLAGRDGVDVTVADGWVRSVEHGRVVEVDRLLRRAPHDVANALAATASALAAGADVDAIGEVLSHFSGLAHRLEVVGRLGEVTFVDDSKATTTAAMVAALRAVGPAVLIAGGRRKGGSLAPAVEAAGAVRAVVAIGESADEVAEAFRAGPLPDGARREVVTAQSMDEAVRRAAALARAGETVLLSPGGASWDWYASYEERGRDFRRAAALLDGFVAAQRNSEGVWR
jgi:UDP-N-acetylmuramoylalanine--D-glutamate ligase